MAEYIQVAGKSNIYIGFPANGEVSAYATLHKLGEQLDDTRLEIEHIFHDVHGDAHGGPQGRPIERQILGMSVRGQLTLSRWDPAVRRRIFAHGVMGTEGAIADHEIGALILRDRSFRIVIAPSRSNPIEVGEPDAGKDYFFWNFPCCCVTGAVSSGQGTKFSVLNFAFEAFRIPAGHPKNLGGDGLGVVWNRDYSLVPGFDESLDDDGGGEGGGGGGV